MRKIIVLGLIGSLLISCQKNEEYIAVDPFAAIKATFATAKASAIATRDAALSAAGSDEVAVAAAKTAFRSTMEQAKATRDAAISQLGAKPTKPAKPVS